nr:phosphoglycerate dehydrogenase [bacterium]
MYKVQTLNAISPIIRSQLPDTGYAIGSDIAGADAILVRSADMHSLELGPSLLAIGRAGAGVNNIPVDRCSRQGIVVFNTPGANANAVRELVICGMLLSCRKVLEGARWAETLKGKGAEVAKLVEKGKSQFVGPELKGKKLGIVGLGAIGVLVANAARGLDMDVMGYDPYISVEAAWGLTRSVTRTTDLHELLSCCDYISLHLPLNDTTRAMIDDEALAAMPRGAVLLNFSRGELVDSAAVIAALDNGHLRHYVTDFPNDDVLCHEGVIALPHLGASTPESEENCAEMAARQLRQYLETGAIHNAVNLPACEMAPSAPHRLAIIHQNIANMVGQITSIIARDNINIENMINKSRGSYAYTLLDLSEGPSAGCLEHIRAIDGICRVRVVY